MVLNCFVNRMISMVGTEDMSTSFSSIQPAMPDCALPCAMETGM